MIQLEIENQRNGNLSSRRIMDIKEAFELMEDLEKGLRTKKHIKKFDRESLLNEFELNERRNRQIQRIAGFFDQKKNIFGEKYL